MLKIVIKEDEFWDNEIRRFIPVPGATVYLEHSLSSISKWEGKWHKPYLDQDTPKSYEETVDYIRCMCLNPDELEDIHYTILARFHMNEIEDYKLNPMTATRISNSKPKGQQTEIVTAEVIYYWMFSQQIPLECENWHFNKLMTLIRVFNIKNGKPEKMSKREIFERNRALNKARKAKMKGGH